MDPRMDAPTAYIDLNSSPSCDDDLFDPIAAHPNSALPYAATVGEISPVNSPPNCRSSEEDQADTHLISANKRCATTFGTAQNGSLLDLIFFNTIIFLLVVSAFFPDE
uniref:Uncharacterized protein n=1 Tax=Kalanchoe fedtschenkoi TaxID=63787 RepID=A0A7N0RJ32_KALFE